VEQHELRYPGTCRKRFSIGDSQREPCLVVFDRAWRLLVPDGGISVIDLFAGRHEFDLQKLIGDFLIWTKQGLPSYQLAVVIDDHRQRISHVVRGDDLLSSAARQQLLFHRLGLEPLPHYIHLPLVVGTDGHRLAKRHGDSRVAMYREAGVSSHRIIALLARWSGIDCGDVLSAPEFGQAFCLDRLPPTPVIYSEDDDRWLRLGT
jgi:glutamyl-tRNA synthetase